MPDLILALRSYEAALPAFLLALALAFAGRALGRAWLTAIAAGCGVLVGWWMVLGLVTASPRQLAERLPLLALVLVLMTPLLVAAARRRAWLALPCVVLGAAWTGWWMAGAPRTAADLARAWPVMAAVGGGALLLALRAWPRWAGPVAAAVLLGGIAVAAPRGPQQLLGAVLLAAACGGALLGGKSGNGGPAAPGALPLAGAIAGLAALPVIARGAPADWATAAAPLAALWLGAPIGGLVAPRLGPAFGAILAGAACIVLALMMR